MRRMITSVMMCGLLVTGCGGGSEEGDAAPATSAPAAAAPSTPPPGGLSENERLGYMTRLAEIDPKLATDETMAIQAGQATCTDIGKGVQGAPLVDGVRSRFSTGGAQIDAAAARKIIAVVKEQLCKS
ncbi:MULTISPECIES: hypothetical protein [Thermomonospora]|nr:MULTISPECIES: hypothetical protein [Thermomonospora]